MISHEECRVTEFWHVSEELEIVSQTVPVLKPAAEGERGEGGERGREGESEFLGHGHGVYTASIRWLRIVTAL